MKNLIKKILCVILLCTLITISAVPINAVQDGQFVEVLESEEQVILTRYNDGTVVESTFTYYPSAQTPDGSGETKSLPEYLPQSDSNISIDAIESPNNTHKYGYRNSGATRMADWLFSMIAQAREDSKARWE